MTMSDSDISVSNNQKVYVSGSIPKNIFHGYSCLAICKKCGLVETEIKQKFSFFLFVCSLFCCLCFFIRQCNNEKYATFYNTWHYCPKCRKRLGIYKPC